MRRWVRTTVGVLGIAGVVCGAVGLAVTWHVGSPWFHDVTPPVLPPPDQQPSPEGDRFQGGTFTVVQILEDGGETGWMLIGVAGLVLSGIAFWPRGKRLASPS